MSSTTPYNTSNLAIYSPALIPGLSLWLDAADSSTVIRSGSNVSQWNDKSGNGYNATQITLGAQPTYSNKYLYLNGVNQYFNVNLDFLAGVSHNSFIVLQNFNYQNIYGAITGGNGSNSLHIGFSNSSNYRMNYWANDWYTSITSNYKINQTNLINYFWYNNTSKTIYTNGGLEGTVNQVGIIGTMSGGGSIGNVVSQGYLNANIYEILIYPTLLTTSQRQQIEGYLAWKWGLQASLPSNHPFYYQPYLPNTVANPYLGLNPICATVPNQISGLSVWLDAADSSTVILSGSNVTRWNDKSGNGYNFTTTSGAPTYSPTTGIYFNGVTPDILGTSSAITVTAGVTSLFIIAKVTAINSNFDYIFVFGGNGADNSLRYNGGQTFNGNDIFYNETWYLNGTVGGTSLPRSIFNNYSLIDGIINLSALTNLQISTTFNGRSFSGYIQECILFSTALTTSQRQQIEGYLAWKWGLQGNLPGSHPSSGPSLPSYFSGTRLYQFQPAIFPGLTLWLDAADSSTIVQNGGSVSQWNDKSGNGYNATATSGHYPTVHTKGQNGLNTLTFDGATQYLQFANSNVLDFNTNDFAVFAAVQFNLNGVTQTFIGKVTTGSGTPQWRLGTEANNNMMLVICNSSACIVSQGPAISGWGFVSGMVYRSSGLLLYLNGTSQPSGGTISGSTSTTTLATIGNLSPSSARYWAADMGEIIVYTGTLTTNQRQQIEGYLAWKWGLQKNLPSSHPFYNFPPG